MIKIIVEKPDTLSHLVQKNGWKIFYFKDNGGSKAEITGFQELENLLKRSNLLLGLAPSEFLWCGNQSTKDGQSLKSQLAQIEQDETLNGALVIPYVDGGLIVISNDDELKVLEGKSADWWTLHY